MQQRDFMEFMGYRSALLEEKIEECLSAARQGMTELDLDCDDLTESEREELQEEVWRRLENGDY